MLLTGGLPLNVRWTGLPRIFRRPPPAHRGWLAPRRARRSALRLAWLIALAGEPVLAVDFAPLRIQRSEPMCQSSVQHGCAYVRFEGLRVVGPASSAGIAIQTQLDRLLAGEEAMDPAATPQATAEAFVGQFEAYRSQVKGRVAPWFLERSVRVLSQRPRLVSFVIQSARYTGGAHPTREVRFLNLDPRSGTPVAAADLFVPGGLERLALRLRNAAAWPNETAPGWSVAGSTSGPRRDRVALPETLGVGPDALILCYNAYEIAPFAAGPRRFEFKLADLRALLRTDGPLADDE